MNWNTTPFLRLVFPLSLGILLAGSNVLLKKSETSGLPWLHIFLLAIFCLAAWFVFEKANISNRWFSGFLLQFFWLIFGYNLAISENELRRDDHFSKISKTENTENWVVGRFTDALTKGKFLRAPLKIEAIGFDVGHLEPASGNLLIYLPDEPENQNFKYGDRIFFKSKISLVEPPKNPNAFDFQRYLHFQNIHFQAFAKTDGVILLDQNQGNFFWQIAFRCREKLLNLLAEHFPTPDEHAAAVALLLGKKDDLPDDLRTAYVRSGSMHALAVSGTHVAVIFAGLMWLLGWLPMPVRTARMTESVVALLVIWAFTLLTGATASVVRAAVMFSIFLVGRALLRDASPWNVIAAAAFFQLLANPYSLFDVGFQLSYAAVAGIIYFYKRFLRYGPDFQSFIAKNLWRGLLVGMAAQLGTLPLTLYYFHQFPVFFWLSGWVVLLSGAIFLYGCFFLMVFSWFSATLAAWVGKALFGIVWLQNTFIYGIEKLPGSVVDGIWISGLAAMGVFGVISLFSAGLEFRQKHFSTAALILLAVLISTNSIRKIGQFDQRKMVIYQTARHSIFDFFDGQKVISFSDSLPEKQVVFAAQNFRWASAGSSNLIKISFEKDENFGSPNLIWQPPILTFFDKKIVVVDKNFKLENTLKIRTDAILLRGNPKFDFGKLAQYFDCQLFVADGSNKTWLVEKWKKAAWENDFQFHDTRTDGAWILNF